MLDWKKVTNNREVVKRKILIWTGQNKSEFEETDTSMEKYHDAEGRCSTGGRNK